MKDKLRATEENTNEIYNCERTQLKSDFSFSLTFITIILIFKKSDESQGDKIFKKII